MRAEGAKPRSGQPEARVDAPKMSYSTLGSRVPAARAVDAAQISSSSCMTAANNLSTHSAVPRHYPTISQSSYASTPTRHSRTQRARHASNSTRAHRTLDQRAANATQSRFPSSLTRQSLPYSPQPLCMQQPPRNASSVVPTTASVPVTGSPYRQDSLVPGGLWTEHYDWAMSQLNVGGPVATHSQSHQSTQSQSEGKSHQRTPSASTVASFDSGSPYKHQQAIAYPHIANTDFSPCNPIFQAQLSAQNFPKSHTFDTDVAFATEAVNPFTFGTHAQPSAYQAMQAFAIDHHNAEDVVPEFVHSSRHSMSSLDNPSPATPPAGPGAVNVENALSNGTTNAVNGSTGTRPPHSNLQLFRTESQAFQDELYNPPADACAATPVPKSTSNFLSPHQSVMSERLQAANKNRSQSPGSAISRERSPFRESSPWASAGDWRSPRGMGTAAGLRQYQKEQAEQAEYARNMPPLQREPTKTISPKDALLDVHDNDQPSLFHDTIPLGYKQHNTGTDAWSQDFVNDATLAYGSEQTAAVSTNFRPDHNDVVQTGAFNFNNMAQNGSFDANQLGAKNFPAPAFPTSKSNQYLSPSDATPQFPAALPSMESSVSDTGPPSSADDTTMAVQRPADTRANTGTYTCTYHRCAQRFDSHASLQKHKREVHRSQHLQVEPQMSPRESSTASSGGGSPFEASPRSSASPAPSGSGMTSAAIMARNSQAGPHKCTRINPSTGKPCNTIFSRPYDLTRHEDTIHNARKLKVRCPLCREEKTFSRNDALTRHMRVVHPEVESYGKRGRRD